VLPTNGWSDQPTKQQTDRAGHRVPYTQLKMNDKRKKEKKRQTEKNKKFGTNFLQFSCSRKLFLLCFVGISYMKLYHAGALIHSK